MPQAIEDNPPGLWDNQQRKLIEEVWVADEQASTGFRENFVAGLLFILSGLLFIFAGLRGKWEVVKRARQAAEEKEFLRRAL